MLKSGNTLKKNFFCKGYPISHALEETTQEDCLVTAESCGGLYGGFR